MNRKQCIHVLAAVMAAILGINGCAPAGGQREEAKKPTVVELWHSYNAVAKSAFDDLVMEFNETVGLEQGIIVESVGYGSSSELDEVLYASASHVIGSDPLPDIFVSYPDGAYRLDGIAPLVHMDDYFTEEELGTYRSEFLEEGVWERDGIHRMIPVAKSTEILYLNETDWNVFAGETGASEEMLKTWEGLARTAQMYYEWSGGSAFLGMNAFNDFAALSAAQLGEGISWSGQEAVFRYSRETARRVWDAYYVPHIKGWYDSRTYNQDGIKSGQLMAYIGSSAGAGFFPQVVIEDENDSHPISCASFVYPVFEGGTTCTGQRGADMAVFSSDESHEQAAVRFIKWFTEPEQNIRFATATGYLPAKKESLESLSDPGAGAKDQDNVQALQQSIQTSIEALGHQNVYIRDTFDGSYDMNQVFGASLENRTQTDLEMVRQRIENGGDRDAAESEFLSEAHFNEWYDTLIKEMAGKTDGQKIQK